MIGTHWKVKQIVRVVDGDTVRMVRERVIDVADGLQQTITDVDTDDDADVDGVSVRLVNLDTPERGDPGYTEAKNDLALWLGNNAGRLRVITYPGGGFDRILGDIYLDGEIGNTATQYMLKDRGWEPYMKE